MRSRGKNDAQAGFTLLELMIALGIFALVTAVAMPLLSRPTGDTALVATARQIASFMRMARATAIRDNDERQMTVDLAARQFWVAGVAGPAPIARGIAVDVVAPEKELSRGSEARIRFHPDGSTSGGQVVLTAAGHRVTVELDWMTGHANVRRAAR
jgi:general secretion pathway protein H